VQRRILTSIVTVGLIALSVRSAMSDAREPVAAPRPKHVNRDSSPSIAELIRRLSHDRYAVRQAAMIALAGRGKEAIPQLLAAADKQEAEALARTIRILERLYADLNSDDATVLAAESALESLRNSKRASAAQMARLALERHDDLRERRALAAIKRLGGIVQYTPAGLQNTTPDPFNHNGEPQVNYILLGRKWKGGDEGLKYITRLTSIPRLNLYVARNKKFTPISLKAQNELQRTMPNISIQERGLACLGVSGSPQAFNNLGCYVTYVKQGSAAAKANLQPGDIISKFAGKKVDSFQKLVDLIAEHNPGESVPVDIIRRGQKISKKVVLAEWTK